MTGNNVLIFPDLRRSPEEKQWRERLSALRREYGGDASRDAELARRIAATCRKLNDRPLRPEDVQWPAEIPLDPPLLEAISRVVRAQLDCADFQLAGAVLNVALTLTGAQVDEDGPLDLPTEPGPGGNEPPSTQS